MQTVMQTVMQAAQPKSVNPTPVNYPVTNTLAAAIRLSLRAAADPQQAVAMAAYMKNIQPFLGIKTPQRRLIVKVALGSQADSQANSQANGEQPSQLQCFQAAGLLWQDAYREEKYAAQDILRTLILRKQCTLADLPLLESMLADCDHWDLLDSQIGLLGRMLIKHPDLRRERAEDWRNSDHFWTRRAAILVQLPAKTTTDTQLLYETIDLLKAQPEFFIQKAIGWALREYAKTNPDWVQSAVDKLKLVGLARREALKHVGP